MQENDTALLEEKRHRTGRSPDQAFDNESITCSHQEHCSDRPSVLSQVGNSDDSVVRRRDRKGTKCFINTPASDVDQRPGWYESLRIATFLWVKVAIKILPVLCTAVMSVWIYYLPAIILSPSSLDSAKDILYDTILRAIRLLLFWGSIALTAIEMFSFQFASNSILFSFVPAYACENVFAFVPTLQSPIFSNIGYSLALSFLGVGLYLIHRTVKPDEMNSNQKSYYDMTKDGSVLALFKGLLSTFALLIFVFINILKMYLYSGFETQIFFRLVLFPVSFGLSGLIHTNVIFNLPPENTERRLLLYKLTNHYIQFIGRILLSNMMVDNVVSFEFALTNFVVSFLEFIYTATLPYRAALAFRFNVFFSLANISLKSIFRRGNHVEPFSPMADSQQDDVENHDEVPEHANRNDARTRYIDATVAFRYKHIYDDVASEICAILMAPLLMYFISPLIPGAPYQSVESFWEAVYQIVIQLFFELIYGVLSLAYAVRRGSIMPADFEKWKLTPSILLFTWSLLCTFSIHLLISLDYEMNH